MKQMEFGEPVQRTLELSDVAHARRTDPETSHAAAASITPQKMTEAQHYVLALFQIHGAMTDTEAWQWYLDALPDPDIPRMSVSGFRTRRSELVARGKLVDSGERVPLQSHRLSIRWEVSP